MSNIRIDNIAPSAGGTYRNAPRGIAAAWVNFNGTGTPAIRDSGNVGSITDNGTGNYTVNFTTAMSDANYSMVAIAKGVAAAFYALTAENHDVARSSSLVPVLCRSLGGDASADCPIVNLTIHGDLA